MKELFLRIQCSSFLSAGEPRNAWSRRHLRLVRASGNETGFRALVDRNHTETAFAADASKNIRGDSLTIW
jgi:hypothetical protein